MNENKKTKVICQNCGIKEVSKVIKRHSENVKLCVDCLEEKISDGSIPPFTVQEIDEITAYLKDESQLDENYDKLAGSFYIGEEENIEKSHNEGFGNKINFGINLNQSVSQRDENFLIGRKEELKETIVILSRKYKSNPVIVGDPGVGKTTLVEGIAEKINKGEVPENLKGKTIVNLTVGELMENTKFRGELEGKVKNILEEVKKRKDIILFIDEMHSLMDLGSSEGSVDVVNIIKPYITSNEVQIIGATTHEEYRKFISKDEAFSRRLQMVKIKEPNDEETMEMLEGIKINIEDFHKVDIPKSVVEKTIKMTNRYLTDKNQPDKTIDILDEASSYKKLEEGTEEVVIQRLKAKLKKSISLKNEYILEDDFVNAKSQLEKENKLREKIATEEKSLKERMDKRKKLLVSDVSKVLERKTGIPVTDLENDDKERLLKLEDNLKKRIKGQEEAVKEVVKFVKRSKLQLKDPNKPNGVFLFLGPTGVGKTELAKALTIELLGKQDSMIRFDMGEFMEKNSVNKLIGSPPGYVGHEDSGKLVEGLRKDPYSVVLFDEIEKAHPDVMNVMLQLFDDGVITDNKGKTIDAKNAIFILTSNAGSEKAKTKPLGFGGGNLEDIEEKKKEDLLDYLRKTGSFKPEFLNRMDSIVMFNHLDKESVREITNKLTDELSERIKDKVKITFTDEAKELIEKKGYNVEYGARQIKREVEKVSDILADELLEGKKKEFVISASNQQITIK